MLSRRTVLFQIALVLGGLSSLRYSLRAEAATVQLDHATVLGVTNDSVTSYLGVPFAYPPYVSESCSSLQVTQYLY